MLNVAGGSAQADADEAARERRAQQADFITAHPTFDRSLWILSQRNPVRRFCQRFVEPSNGERIFGVAHDPRLYFLFRLAIFAAIVGSIVIAAVATPVFRRQYFIDNGDVAFSWFNLVEVRRWRRDRLTPQMGLGMVFVAEFIVKVVADGFVFAPNAYLLSIWNALDFFVLLTLIVNIVTTLVAGAGVNRFTRALKALRTLRLINLSERMRQTFLTVFVTGFSHIIDASMLALLYIIPFAVWGQNLFSGLLYFCTDNNAATVVQCVGEYVSQPSGNYVSSPTVFTAQFSYSQPRAWINPYVWAFDTFRQRCAAPSRPG